MKTNPANILNRILVAVLAMLGFSACGEEKEPLVEYGTPSVSYRIKGTVTDENNTPIEGIKVVIADMRQYSQENSSIVYTGDDGKFIGPHTVSFGLYGQTVTFEDVDGEDNGGSFRSATIGLDGMSRKKLEEGGRWYAGDYELTADVKLERER